MRVSVSPRKTPRRIGLSPATSGIGSISSHRRLLFFGTVACFYITISGHLYMARGDGVRKDNNDNKVKQHVSTSTALVDNEKAVNFMGYPLTREGMIATGAQMGFSAVERLQAKQQQAALEHTIKDQLQVPFWCRPRPVTGGRFLEPLPPNQTTAAEGLFFVKTPKTASQSINRILRRVVARVGSRSFPTKGPCHLRGHHIQGPAAWYGNRHQVHSVLITSLRDPVPRALSRIYWTLSTRQFTSQGIDVPLLQSALTQWTDPETGVISNGQGGFQLQYVSFPTIPKQSAWTPDKPAKVSNPDQIHNYVQQVLYDYDFILLQERIEESLVALQLLLGLEVADILSMPLHVGGSYLFDRIVGCLELVPPPKLSITYGTDAAADKQQQQSPASDPVAAFLEDYLQSPTWFAQNYGDYVLWGAAHASLDQTIQALGPIRFQQALSAFQQLQNTVVTTCSKQVVFPCSVNGTIQRDDYLPGSPKANGDRYPQDDIEACIDQVVKRETEQKKRNG